MYYAYGGNNIPTDLPTLRCYADALAHLKNIKPIRGTNIHPICDTPNGRRKKHMTIGYTDEGREAIACTLHDTNVLEFYPDGEVRITINGWATQSTVCFLNGLLPSHIYGRIRKSQIVITYTKSEYGRDHIHRTSSEYIVPQHTCLRFRSGDEWEPINPPVNKSYVLNRKAMSKRYKPVEAFRKAVVAMAAAADPEHFVAKRAVRGGLVGYGGEQSVQWSTRVYEVMQRPDTPEYGALVADVLSLSKQHEHVRGRYVMSSTAQYFATYKIRDIVRNVVKRAFADELFDVVETEKVSTNGNEKYIASTIR